MRVLLNAALLSLLGCLLAVSVLADPYELLAQTVVQVDGAACKGSGSVVRAKSRLTYILTNAHVCHCANYKNKVFSTRESGALISGAIVKEDWGKDLCAVKVEEQPTTLLMGDSPNSFTVIYTRGYPGERLTTSKGHMSSLTEWQLSMSIEDLGECPKGSKKEYDTSGILRYCTFHFVSRLSNLYARPGSSGSPVVDGDGGLVGVVSSWHTDSDYDAGLVPYSDVKNFLSGL